MLSPDIVQLKQFYATRLGESVAQHLTDAMAELWPKTDGEILLVIGYGVPYVASHRAGSTPVIIAMPAEQGAAAWPPGQHNRVLLTHDYELPLQNNSVGRVLLIHSIEHSEHLNAMMQEVWRVLIPGGKLLAVVPNRVSLWSESSKSPFGAGRPFNILQLRAFIARHQFTITDSRSALFTPPFLATLSRHISHRIERVGRWLWWFMGGVLIMEAEKQLYASISEPILVRKPRPVVMGARAASPT